MLAQTIASAWKFDNPIAILDVMGRFEADVVRHLTAGSKVADNLVCPVCGCVTVKVTSIAGLNVFQGIINKDLAGSAVRIGYTCILCGSTTFLSSRKVMHENQVSLTVLKKTGPVLRLTLGSSKLGILTDLYSAVVHILDVYEDDALYPVILHHHASFLKRGLDDIKAKSPGSPVQTIGCRLYPKR